AVLPASPLRRAFCWLEGWRRFLILIVSAALLHDRLQRPFATRADHVQTCHRHLPAAAGDIPAVSGACLASALAVASCAASKPLDPLFRLGTDRRWRAADALGRFADALAQDHGQSLWQAGQDAVQMSYLLLSYSNLSV